MSRFLHCFVIGFREDMEMIWYKIMLTLETMTIWLLLRKHGYFDGLTLNPKSIKRRDNRDGDLNA